MLLTYSLIQLYILNKKISSSDIFIVSFFKNKYHIYRFLRHSYDFYVSFYVLTRIIIKLYVDS